MNGIVVMIIILAGFLMMAFALLCGKESLLFMDSTSTFAKEKQQFDRKKLCRSAGVMMLYDTMLLAMLTYLCFCVETERVNDSLLSVAGILFILLVLVGILFEFLYVGRRCRKTVS